MTSRAESHYVVKRCDAGRAGSYMHKNRASRSQTFPELWNSARPSLAGSFRLQGRRRELEQTLESGWAKQARSGDTRDLTVRIGVRKIPP